MRTLLYVLPALFLIQAGPAHADGLSVAKRLSLDDLAKTSDAIFTATLLENDTQWDSVEVHGGIQRFVRQYLFRIAVTGWLKGKVTAPQKGVPWLSLPGDPIPGAWTIVAERYDASFELRTAKTGDKVVVFASASDVQGWADDVQNGRAVLQGRAVETYSRLPEVRVALGRPSHKEARRPRSRE